MRVRGACVSAVIAIIFALSAATALARQRQATIIGGRGARTISTSPAHGEMTGTLEVLVRNDSHHYARPTAQFIPATALPYTFRKSAQLLRPGQVEPVMLTFKASSAEAMKGTVAIGLSGRRTVREQTIQVAPEATASAPAVEPAEVTLHLTRLCLLGHLSIFGHLFPFSHLLCGSSRTPTIAVSASALKGLGNGSKRLAASDTGGRATITLVPVAPSSTTRLPNGLVPVKVYVRDDSHGEYVTTFTLDPEAKQDGAIKVKVEVQVWWIYPLLVLLIGALLGYLIRWFGGSYRERELLKRRLEKVRNDYEEELPGRSPGIYPLRRWFGQFNTAVPTIPRRREYDSPELSGFAKCWQSAQQARSATDIANVEKTVQELEDDYTAWHKIDKALKGLDRSFRTAVPEGARNLAIPAYQETRALTDRRTVTQPADVKAAETVETAIEVQGKVVEAYEPARATWNAVTDKTEAMKELDPAVIYALYGKPLAREEPAGLELVVKLEEAKGTLTPDADTKLMEAAAAAAQDNAPAANPQAARIEPVTVIQPPRRDRDPRHLRHGFAITDWVFGVTLLASSVGYLVTLYVGKNFGSSSQYVEAFAAGFGGQALLGVAAFPLTQSLFSTGQKQAGT
jgi:hypothetical protein